MVRQQLRRPATKKNSAASRPRVLDSLAPFDVLLPKRVEVQAYLARFRQIANLLGPICAALRGDLGPTVELSVELYHDPEIDDTYLTLYVRKKAYDRKFIDKINAVSSKFDSQLASAPGHLVITTDFRLPRGENAL
jgi:hypothetical protein